MILDTCFLIDLHRELKGGRDRGAGSFLQERAAAFPRISLVSWMEFAEGFGDDRTEDCSQFLGRFPVVAPNERIAWAASRLARVLRERGQPVGDHDVWIGATALTLSLPVVTNNRRHFERMPGVQVMHYGGGL